MPRLILEEDTVIIQTGGGGTGNVAWGSSFGQSAGDDQSTHDIGISLDLDSIDIENTQGLGVNFDLDALALENTQTLGLVIEADLGYENTKTIGINNDLDAIGLEDTKTIGILQTYELATENTQTVGINSDLDSIDLEHTKTVGIDIITGDLSTEHSTQLVGINTDLDDFATENTKTTGLHLSATVESAPFWQSVQTNTAQDAGGVGSIAVTKPVDTAVGDLLLAFVGTVSVGAAATVNVPAGWTAINNTAITTLYGRAFYRIADGTEGASITFTFASNATQTVAEIHRIIGTHATTPIDVSAVASVVASDLDPDPDSPLVTTTVVNTLVFAWLLHDHAALTQSHTAGASHVERTDFESNLAGVRVSGTSQTRAFSATGSTGTIVHDCTETASTDGLMIRVAIKPGTLTIAS